MACAYLDNSATTRPCEAAIAAMERSLREQWYNPSAVYKPSVEAFRALRDARQRLLDNLGGAGCDQELDASCSDEERFSYDANDLAEMLVAPPDPRITRALAHRCLEETFAKLPPETVRAFRAWIEADGVLGEAARLCGESRFAYRRKWTARVAAFRAACTWRHRFP